MISSVANLYLNAANILRSNALYYLPISIPVRHHLGYLPMQGRLHPWDIEETRVHRQVKRLNLKPVKRMVFSFDPFHPSVKSIRHIVYHFSSEKVRGTNPKCIYKTDIISDRSEPTLSVYLDDANADLGCIIFKTANLKPEDVLNKFNEMILPLIKVESEDERTTKGAIKKTAQKDVKKKKGGK